MKKMFGNLMEIMIGVAVVIFLGFQSINFFMFVFPDDQWYLAIFGFALTSGGLLGYLSIFLTKSKTKTEKFVSIGMMVVCLIGEILTAYFGMEISGWEKLGYSMTQTDFSFMLKVINGLALLHGVALLAYVAGDKIANAVKDDDGDGIPNFMDPDYYKPEIPSPPQPFPQPSPRSRVYPYNEDPTQRQ